MKMKMFMIFVFVAVVVVSILSGIGIIPLPFMKNKQLPEVVETETVIIEQPDIDVPLQ